MTLSLAVASAPIPFSVETTDTTISVRWLPPDFPNGVVLSYNLTIASNTSSSTGVQTFTVGETFVRFRIPFTFTNLEPFTEYQIQIQAVNGFGGGEVARLVAQTSE